MSLLSYSEFKKSLSINEAKKKTEEVTVEDVKDTTPVDLDKALREYGSITTELNKIYADLKIKAEKLEKDQSELFDKIFKEMDTSNKNLHAVDKIVAQFSIKKGASRTNPKYKEAFEAALTKVNDATKKVLNEVLELNTTKTVGEDKKSLKIEISESVVSDTFDKIKDFIKSIGKKLKSLISEQSDAVKELEKVAKESFEE